MNVLVLSVLNIYKWHEEGLNNKYIPVQVFHVNTNSTHSIIYIACV